MGLDNMRGSGRCPPFLVGGLFVVCVILTFNWWSLSSQNYDLIRQLEDVTEQLKLSSEEQDLCVHQRLSMERRIKNTEEEIQQLHVQLEQQKSQVEDDKKQINEKDEEIKKQKENEKEMNRCKTELESLKKLEVSKDATINTLRLENKHISQDCDKKQDEIKKLEKNLEEVQTNFNMLKAVKEKPDVPNIETVNKASPAKKRTGDLSPVRPLAVQTNVKGLKGMIFHPEPILPKDPPDAFRPKPRYSITNLRKGSVPAAGKSNNGVDEGGDHEQAKNSDIDKAENDENNARERDDGNAEQNLEPEPAQPDEIEQRMEGGNIEEEPDKPIGANSQP